MLARVNIDPNSRPRASHHNKGVVTGVSDCGGSGARPTLPCGTDVHQIKHGGLVWRWKYVLAAKQAAVFVLASAVAPLISSPNLAAVGLVLAVVGRHTMIVDCAVRRGGGGDSQLMWLTYRCDGSVGR